MVLRDRKRLCYTESSSESGYEEESDYEEESKDKIELISKKYVREVHNSREDTPCPTTHGVTNLIITPNKPSITNVSYNQYSTHMICAFESTLHLVKETIEKQLFEEIERIYKMRNKSVLKSPIVKKLEVILQSDYSVIASKIMAETEIEDNEITEDARFLFFIRHTLLDFVATFKFLSPKVISWDMSERSYIVECLSPILRAFRNSFPDIRYEWIEKDVGSIKGANNIFLCDIQPRKTDLLILRLSDATEILDTEVSGPPFNSTKKHTIGDTKKLLLMSVCSLCKILANNFDCPIKDAKGVRTYCIQAISDRLTLFATSLIEKKKYLAIELASCIIPFSFDTISCYTRIFNFFAIIRKEFVEQEEIQKKIRSFIPSADNGNYEDLREWIHQPDDDLAVLTEDDMDEIFFFNRNIIVEDYVRINFIAAKRNETKELITSATPNLNCSD
ncbi:hypothetical protein RclHR1_01140004 [Rhizophagus clarus]|uniref:Uncharacterized protein n=1 Tax=Rhizophagus clarus TaxID=94130 RepID=A0A2Z6Q5L2_9GLOM|nr:hypothetical protein RclHR1_01140004 [Rhizophagus clarus]